MTGRVRDVAKAYNELKQTVFERTQPKPVLRLPDLEFSAHETLVFRAAKHYLETQLLTGKGVILSPEETELLDDGWVNSVNQAIQAILYEAQDRKGL